MDVPTSEETYFNISRKFYDEAPPSVHLSFIPTMYPPTLSPAKILRVLTRSIDKLLVSEFGSIKYKLLVEELCAFVEDVDSNKIDESERLEPKLVKLINGLGTLELKCAEKAHKSHTSTYEFTGSFHDLLKPLVVYYPVQGDDKALFYFESAAHPVRFDSVWRGLTDIWAEDIWRLFALIDELLLHEAKQSLEAHSFSYPKSEFLSNLKRRGCSFNTEPIWLGSEERIIQFLNTCTSFRSIKTTMVQTNDYLQENSYKFDLQKGHNLGTDRFCRFMRQIVVPVQQTVDIVSGGKVIITPILWDPHQTYDALRKKTSYRFYPKYLDWDEDTESFTGKINLGSNLAGRTYVDIRCHIYALTSEILLEGIRFETTVQAFINLRIHISAPQGPVLQTLGVGKFRTSDSRPLSEGGFGLESNTGEGCCSFWQNPDISLLGLTAFKAEDKAHPTELAGSSSITNKGYIFKAPDIISYYGGRSPIFKQRKIMDENEGIVSLRWDSEQWFSVILRVEPGGGFEWESINNPDIMSDRSESTSDNVEPTIGGVMKLLEDNLEQVQCEGSDLTLGLEIELVLAKSDGNRSGSRVFEDISNIFKQLPSTKVHSTKDVKPSSFGSVIFGLDTRMKDVLLGYKSEFERRVALFNLGMNIEQQRCIQWRKLVLPKVLGSLSKFDNNFNEFFTVSLHIGKKGGYNFREIKCIAKLIIIYGDLFDYSRLMYDERIPGQPAHPGFGSRHHNQDSKKFTVSENINLIDKAASLEDIIKIMNPEYHNAEEYRFDFSKLESQGTIVWTQLTPKVCASSIPEYISGVLSVNTAAMKVEDSYFIELAKSDATWDNLVLLLQNDKTGIMELGLSNGKGGNLSGK